MAKRIAKWLTVICVVCCMAMAFVMTGCANDSARVELTSVTIDANGHLIATYSDETTQDLGSVLGQKGDKGDNGANGENGKDGVGIKNAQLNDKGEFVIEYTNGDTVNLGAIKGTDGTNGTNGVGVSKIEMANNGLVTITYTDGSSTPLGTLKFIAKTEYKDGKLVVTYNDGSIDNVALKGVLNVELNEENELVITFYDGSTQKIGISTPTADCEHANIASEATVKPASCCEEGVKLVICKDCGAVISQAIEKNGDHGKWEYKAIIDEFDPSEDFEKVYLKDANDKLTGMVTYKGETTGTTGYVLATNYQYGSMTTLEDKSGACYTAVCKDCDKTIIEGHAAINQWIEATVESNANICEEEHPTYLTCPTCKAAFLYVEESELNKEVSEITNPMYAPTATNKIYVKKSPAKGHSYSVNSYVKVSTGDHTGEYKVTLICADCTKEQVVYAKLNVGKSQQATCKAGGYNVYTYTYTNWVNGVKKTDLTGDIKPEDEITDAKKLHTVAQLSDGSYLQYTALQNVEYTDANKEFIGNDKQIKWNEGAAANCATKNLAVFTCKVCEQPVVINLSGEHTLGAEQHFDGKCTEDSYDFKECAGCEYVYKYNEVAATGHKYVAVAGTLSEEKDTFSAKCSKCQDVQTVTVLTSKENTPTSCAGSYYTEYTGKVSNGIGGEQNVTLTVQDTTKKPIHNIGENVKVQAANNSLEDSAKYEYTENIAKLFAKPDTDPNQVAWNEGIPSTCSDYQLAVGECVDCKKAIIFFLSGLHDYGTNSAEEHEPTCTERGYTTKLCNSCHENIEQSSVDAKGHTFKAETTSWAAFIADPKAGVEVKYVCSVAGCTAEVTLTSAQKGDVQNGSDACTNWTKTIFEFKVGGKDYTYTVKDYKNEDITKTFVAETYEHKVNTGSHTIGVYNGTTYTTHATAEIESNEAYEYFVTKGIIEWNEGAPAACNTKNYAVFTCTKCNHPVVIKLSGKHNLTGEVTPATCTTPEYTRCVDCKTSVETAPVNGHKYSTTWTVEVGKTNVSVDVNGDLVVTHVSHATAKCANCPATLDTVENQVKTQSNKAGYSIDKTNDFIKPTCGKGGQVTIRYFYDNKEVATEVVNFNKLETHKTGVAAAEQYVKYFDGTNWNLAYYCKGCQQFVVAKTGTQDEVNTYIKTTLGLTNVNTIPMA